MSAPANPPCAICRKPVPPSAENSAFPFCSDRCKVIDLGKWLSGDYAVPGEEAEVGEGGDGERPEKLH